MKTFLKFILLVVILNVIRYLIGGPIEALFVIEGMFGVMSQHPNVFDSDFSSADFAISFVYNFMLWFSATAAFYIAYPALNGHFVKRSLIVFGVQCFFFLSVTAVYMNHYADPIKPFYLYSMLDAIILFPLVGIANGLIFPLMFRAEICRQENS